MKKQLFFPIILLLLAFTAAKAQQVGALTVFSEDGDKFFLILNGQRQNDVAQTNIRVDGLTQPYYNAKIIFENKALPEISKNMMIADQSNTMMDVTYKIKHDKSGNPKVGGLPFSFVPHQQNYTPAPDVYVVHYGAPAPAPATTTTTTVEQPAATTTYSQTTTTTTAAVPGASVNMNVAGVNMGVTVNDPALNASVQTTTTRTVTHTTTTTTETTPPPPPAPAPVPVGCKGQFPMAPGDFSSAVSTIKNQGFDETKLSTAKQIAGGNCLSAGQIAEICKLFGFEETKLTFAKFAYDHCTEPQNYFKINNVFGFSSSVDELNSYIQGK
ncbi:MAG TPA: DUF4476 domain-containing protein [Chitinophagales bacterium]|nr:DUF4476 domain-containing protein [Chitinophagales bacterium]